MSPIGRVFIVLNLGLAFAFVGFAGTYLKHATNWKAKYDDASAKAESAAKKSDAEIEAAQKSIADVKGNLTASETSLKQNEVKLAEANAELTRKAAQLDAIAADLAKAQSNLATIAEKVDASTGRADDAYKMALKAADERNEAMNVKVKAEDELAKAKSNIADLEGKLAETNQLVANLKAEVGEKDTLLTWVRSNNQGLLPNPVPSMSGSVVMIDPAGKLMTVRLAAKAGEPKAGHSLAIHANGRYKGEFVVDTVEGDMLFGRFKGPAGSSASAGDKADSNPGR